MPPAQTIAEALKEGILVFDGAMGTEIYRRHVFVNTSFDELNLTRPDLVREIHDAYVEAGADVLITNTFGAHRLALSSFGIGEKVREINASAARLAREAAEASGHTIHVAGDVGPIVPDRPDRDDLVEAVREQVAALLEGGVDFIFFETQRDRPMVERAAEAMRAWPDVPYAVSVTVYDNGESAAGEPLERLLAPFADGAPQPVAWGLNCGVGPDRLLAAVERAVRLTAQPLVVEPNAGHPREVGGRMIYMCSPEYIAEYAKRYVALGVVGVGGCCGTTPEHIRVIARTLKPLSRTRVKVAAPLGEACVLKEETPFAERSRLAWHLAHRRWVQTVELVPPRGYDLSDIVAKARVLHRHGVDAVNLPDGPRASSRISPLVTAQRIQDEAKIETILHFCSRDRNLIGMQADLLACAACDVRNILFITGDPPKLGKYPYASGVFDVDSIGMVGYQTRLNRGVDIGGQEIDPPTRTVIGVGADPTALDPQRERARLIEKIEAGAEFAITQPVFDPAALLAFLDRLGDTCTIPVLAGVWPLASYRNALFMKNEVPGVTVPDAIMERMEAVESREDQQKVGIEIARESVERVRDRVAGIQVSAPFGNVQTALAVIMEV